MATAPAIDELYSRGQYRLDFKRKASGELWSPNLHVFWYDPDAGTTRAISTGTADHKEASLALDRLFEQRERGVTICPACNRPLDEQAGYPLAEAIASYLISKREQEGFNSIRSRLAHVLDYMAKNGDEELLCEDTDEEWIRNFRVWMITVPVVSPAGNRRERALGTVEASVRQLAAAVNHAHQKRNTLYKAAFKPRKPSDVSNTPVYRADIQTLAAMFDYCINPTMPARPTDRQRSQWNIAKARRERQNLLRFLQISVATWCRPDAAHDVSVDPKRQQWIPSARVLKLNPKGRVQTRKRRPAVPVPECMAVLLDQADGFYVKVQSVKKAMNAMLDELGMPREGETGLKLIRRSMATIARRPQHLGEEHWAQGELMLGHTESKVSDVYALPDPANLGRVLAVTEAIIAEIEKSCPQAYWPE